MSVPTFRQIRFETLESRRLLAVIGVELPDSDGNGAIDIADQSRFDDSALMAGSGNDTAGITPPLTVDGSVTEAKRYFTGHTIATSVSGAWSVFAADLDGDGDADVLSAAPDDDKIAWYENDGTGGFTAHRITTSANGAWSVYAADMDNDGDTDVLSAAVHGNEIAWYENDGLGVFETHVITTSANLAWSVFAEDVDGDGDMDVLSACTGDDKLEWYENDGSQNFTAKLIASDVDSPRSVFAAELNGDGHTDVLSASDDGITWFENDGEERFTSHAITAAFDAIAVRAADLDGDGDMDVLSAGEKEIAWYENDGTGSFTAHTIEDWAVWAFSVHTADVDSDGDLDVLSAAYGYGEIAWHENDGAENFTTHMIAADTANPRSVYGADVDADGDMDVLVATAGDDKITWYENDVAEITVNGVSGLMTSEAGDTTAFSVAVNREPTTDVTIAVSSDDKTEGTVSTESLTFTADNWTTSQTVTITGVNDDTDDDDVGYTIVLSPVTSSDPKYSGMNPSDVSVTNTDDDTAGIMVSPTSGLTTSEGGDHAEFNVVLNSEPTSDVIVEVVSNDTTEGVVSPTSLTFTAANWSTQQTVTVTGVDDAVDDDNVSYTISVGPVASFDPKYAATDVADVVVTNVETHFLAHDITTSADSAWGVHTADINEDGHMDVLSASAFDDAIRWYENNGNEGFLAHDITTNADFAESVYATDMDNDGDPDVLSASVRDNKVAWYRNDGTEGFTEFVITTSAIGANSVYAADVDGNGYVDVLSASRYDNKVICYWNEGSHLADGNWKFMHQGLTSSADGAESVYAADVTGDDRLDVLSASANDGRILLFENRGDRDFTVTAVTTDAAGVQEVYATDVDNDGNVDVLAAVGNNVLWYRNDGSGVFTPQTITDSAGFAWSVFATDFDGDTKVDVLSASLDDGKIAWHRNVGKEGFADFTVADSVLGATSVHAADVDGDGDMDVLSASFVEDKIAWYENLDDWAGITMSPLSGLATDESGVAVTLTVVLDTEPTGDVTIPVAVSDPTEGTVAVNALLLTPQNWSTPQTVTVSGVNDDFDDGDVAYTIVLEPTISSDPKYSGIDLEDFSVTNLDDDTAGISVDRETGLTTTEAGGQATFSVVLDSEPTDDVTIGMSCTNSMEGTTSSTTLVFTPNVWSTPQTVTVSGVNDDFDDGDVAYTIVLEPTISSDPKYSGIDLEDFSVTNLDDDTAGISVDRETGLTTTEAGGQATFSVVLDSEPTDDVTVAVSSDDPAEGTVSPGFLAFTADNWSSPQTATVTGVNDDMDDGDIAYTIIVGSVTSSDSQYSTTDPNDVTVSNVDDDQAGVAVNPTSGLVTSEQGDEATFTIVLESKPTADVTVTLSSSDPEEGIVPVAPMVFTVLNWSIPQTVTVSGVDDDKEDVDVFYTVLIGPVTSNDEKYAAIDPHDVTVTNRDDDTPGIAVTPTSGLMTSEMGGEDVFAIVLDSRPTANVAIAVASSDLTEGTVSPNALVFTTEDWTVPQTVTVTGVNDDLDDGAVNYRIEVGPITSEDLNYSTIEPDDVTATNHETRFVAHTITTSFEGAWSVFAADLDSDGDMDVLSASNDDDTIAWHDNDGEGNFTGRTITTSADGAWSVFATDVDGDGDTDVLSASQTDDTIAWYENDGLGVFETHVITTSANLAWSVFAEDVDGDGDMDVLSACTGDDKLEWYENDGSQNFTAKLIASDVDSPRSVFAAELNGDGHTDVLSASDDGITWFENDGEERFTSHAITAAFDAIAVRAADLDGDGDMDVLSAGEKEIAWYENDGRGNFVTRVITTAIFADNLNLFSVHASDVDKDGDMDILSASYFMSSGKVVWYENDGAESFSAHTITASVDDTRSVFAADFDNDGDTDVLSASPGDNRITWYEHIQETQPVDVGRIESGRLNSLDPAANEEIWVRLQATHDGWLTFQSAEEMTPDQLQLGLYAQENLDVPLVTSQMSDATPRIDCVAGAGQTYLLKVTGSASDVTLISSNLVHEEDGAVTVHGTETTDELVFDAGASREITINGIAYHYEDTEVASIAFEGGAGRDVVWLRDSAGDEVLEAWPYRAILRNGEGDGQQDYIVTVSGIEDLLSYATRGGNDTAILHGSDGSDKLKSYEDSLRLRAKNSNYTLRAKKFDTIVGDSGTAGNDMAVFNGTDGAETFRYEGAENMARLEASSRDHSASGFGTVVARAGSGDGDVAYFIDIPTGDPKLDDVFYFKPHKTNLNP